MLRTVIKRNGKEAKFMPSKIRIALDKANKSVDFTEQVTDAEIDKIISEVKHIRLDKVHIEVIQDMVEDMLMDFKHKKLARNYIIYRYKHSLERDLSESEISALGLLNGSNLAVVDENSNKNSYANSTQRDLMAGEMSRTMTKKLRLPDDIRLADERMEIHWHDIDYSIQQMINCCLINIKSILDYGTVMQGILIESPRSFRVACNVMAQVVANIASNQYGGQSIAIKHLGKYLKISEERYMIEVAKEWKEVGIKYTNEQLKKVVAMRLAYELEQGVQNIQYSILCLMTTCGQAPFLTLFLQLDDDDPYIDYTAMIIEEIIKQRTQGIKNEDGKYITPSFPKLIYCLDENNCLEGGRFDYITKMAAKCTIKRSYPDYISAKIMREHFDGEVFSCMGCRSFLSPWKKTDWYVKMMGEPESEIGKYLWEGRFNQGVVTINLPQIAIIADHDMDKFWSLLEERLALCYKALLLRHHLLEGTSVESSPLHWRFGGISRLERGATIDKLLHDGFSTISLGYIGIYETVYALIGVSHTTPEGKDLAFKIMNRLADACTQWKEQTGLGFGLYGTPAESLCYKFCQYDAEHFGIIENVTDKGYYTNSFHIDVREEINAFDKFAFEAPFQKISSGGCISYCEIPNLEQNQPLVEKLINYIYHNIRYGEFNSKSDYCFACGFEGQIDMDENADWVCPCCGNKDMKKMYVSRRTCGYLGSNQWNLGKRKEMKLRVEHV